ncbi:Rpn family recombination-promoting nuclease/putative transposase, partial [Holdemania filiformis]
FQAKDIRLDICARLTPDRLIDFEMQCGSNKMEIPNRSAYYAATLVNRPDNKGLAYTALTPVDQLFLL